MEIKELEDIARANLTLADDIIAERIPYCVERIQNNKIREILNCLIDEYDDELFTEADFKKMKKSELVELLTKVLSAQEQLHKFIY